MHHEVVGEIGVRQAHADAVLERANFDGGIVSQEADVSGAARAQTFEDFDGRGFARPIGAEQSEYFALRYIEVDAADGLDIAIGFVQASDVDGWTHAIEPILAARVAGAFREPANGEFGWTNGRDPSVKDARSAALGAAH